MCVYILQAIMLEYWMPLLVNVDKFGEMMPHDTSFYGDYIA